MKKKSESRSHTYQMFALLVVAIFSTHQVRGNSTDQKENAEILIKEHFVANSSNGVVPKILKLTQNGNQKVVQAPEIIGEQLFTLKSDPVRVQSDFKTVDISVLNRQRDKENAKKVAIVQEDLQSRIKINEPETTPRQVFDVTEPEVDPEEIIKKQAKVKEDIESRVLLDDGVLGYRKEAEREEKLHYPVKRSDDDYYADEPEPPQQTRMTTEAPKEEDSFFSIFESLFGSSDDDSQSKKKSRPEDEPMYKDTGDSIIKENIKTVGSLLKPMKPIDKPEPETQNAYAGYQNNAPEYRIVNNYHASQSHKQTYKQPEPKPAYHSFYRPTEKPLRPYKPYSTSGYEDYDLEEFMDKGDTTRVKYVSPIMTSTATDKYPTTPSTTIATTTITKTTPKNIYDNKLKFPSIQKKNDYINRNRYQEVKSEVTEKITERVTYQKPEIKTTTEHHYYSRPNHENKDAEIKTQKIQESANFYNLINLPVRYSTKDTAIPLISTSYANTKIQGMGAHKYEKGSNGKYPNHKYDQSSSSSSSTTKRPNYWATKRTSTEKTTTSFRPSQMISKITTKHTPGSNLDKVEYDDDFSMGLGPELGNYGSKTGVEVKTQTPFRQTSTTNLLKETTTRRNDNKTPADSSHQTVGFYGGPNNTQTSETPEKTFPKPVKELYEDYEYINTPDQGPESRPSNTNENYPQNFFNKQSELEYKPQYQTNSYKTTRTPTVTPMTEAQRPPEISEYEYYDYDMDPSTTTTSKTTTLKTTTPAVTTSKYKVKYPNLPKDKIVTSSSEKLAVVIPSKNHDFYNENQASPSSTRTSTVVVPTTTPTTTISVSESTIPPKPSQTTADTTKPTDNEILNHFKKTTQIYRPNQAFKEPAPVFEDVREDFTTKQILVSTTKKFSEKSTTTTESSVKPLIVTSSSKEQETNANIVLVPTKETFKTEGSSSEPPSSGPFQKSQPKPTEAQHSAHDYTTEFTVGVVHNGNGIPYGGSKNPSGQGHYVASSVSTNPYGDDEPFRPIPKPPGMTSSFHLAHEDSQKQPSKNPQTFQNKRPIPTPPALEETEPIHEPHEFIPSPQFHRPLEPKPSVPNRPGSDVDYDFEGIQTEPKPGQYVIFSKPQLNPEMNENQVKKKTEISSTTKTVSNVPHFHDKINPYWPENQQHVVFNPSEGQIYQNIGKPKPSSDKLESGRPVYGNLPKDDRLPSLQLVPPRGSQPEKPFEGNFVLPEEKQESAINYPRPHWEKNGKPPFLMNTLSNKNDIVNNRHPPVPPQMAPTLIPPSSAPPQRFRRPLQPHMPPMRKNFNEGGINVKQKPNLPNILPQFRPNTKVGSGPYHRPPGYHGSNRRNGMNRYHEKEHGNFPYHIQHPEKDAMHREYEMESEIIPKFITNRGKLPNEMWNSQGMQKRFGQGPQNVYLDENSFHLNQKILRRHQRTPVTTLQMLKQMPGIKTQKSQISREDSADSSVPLSPPIYKTYADQPKKNENVYIVYPARAPQKLYPGDTKVFIVSDTKSKKNYYNLTKLNDYTPVVNLNKKENLTDFPKNSFPYGFVKPVESISDKKKEQNGNEENLLKNTKNNGTMEQTNFQKQEVTSGTVPTEKDEKIDMTLHMQSNNQWNEVKTVPDLKSSIRNPPEIIRNDHYRFSDHSSGGSSDNGELQLNPPSEYHTSIKADSAFTLGAVMHTMSEGSKKGLVANIPLRNNDEKINLPKLNVNERISNGKIVTVSMPLDVKQDSSEKENQYQFQAPFQPSSSLTSKESEPISQGWSIVKSPEDESEQEDGKKTTETSTSSFNFENFKPELIGGFKPIFELPEEPEDNNKQEKTTNTENGTVSTR